MLDNVLVWLVDIGMAVGPILGYVSQYRLIKASQSVGSFSIDICGILLFANILRLNFFIFKRYEITLVFQSLFMISMQMLLLYECSKYPAQEDPNVAQEIEPALEESRDQCAQRVQQFWRWKGFEKYGVAVLFFIFCTFATSFIIYLTPLSGVYGELVGIVALMSESILIAPQIARNIQKQSTKGLSHMLVTFNLSGDIFKLVFFIMNDQPFQFILCGIIQVILDSFVIIQIFYYSSKQKKGGKNLKIQTETPIKSGELHQQKQLEPIDSEANLDMKIQTLDSQRQNNGNQQFNTNKIQLNKGASKSIKITKQQAEDNEEKNEENYEELKQQINSDQEKGDKQPSETDKKGVKSVSTKSKSEDQDGRVGVEQEN